MNYAIEMFFDKETDTSIREIWNDLHESKQSSYMSESGSIPHVSLTVFNQLDIDECNKRLTEFANSACGIEISLASIGTFPTV